MKYLTCSFKLSRLKGLNVLLEGTVTYDLFALWGADAYIGWGEKEKALQARRKAAKAGKPFYYLEDGFLRSLYPSHLSKMPLSIIKDSKGIYYNYKTPTDLEDIIRNTRITETNSETIEALSYYKKHALSKYCISSAPHKDYIQEDITSDSVILLDQVWGDSSLAYGGIDAITLAQSLQSVLNNKQTLYIKMHPDVMAGKKQSCFKHILKEYTIQTLDPDISLHNIFKQKPHIVTLTSLAGFEALLHGCKVTTLGIPWYAGYGLTYDRHPNIKQIKARRPDRTLLQLFHSAYIQYPLYFNPVTFEKGSFWDVAFYLAQAKQHVLKLSGNIHTYGVRPWKRKDISPFIQTPFNNIIYTKKNIQENDSVLIWGYKDKGSKDISDILQTGRAHKIIRTEDGFIRSYGLGADFIPPMSLVFDPKNLYYYYDVKHPSIVQEKLQEKMPFFIKPRIKYLKEQILTCHINKYNVDYIGDVPIQTDKPVLLVIGQVDQDASLKYGALRDDIASSFDMLKYAKKNFPGHYIIYKPHPDVIRGHRVNEGSLHEWQEYAHKVEMKISILSLIYRADHILCMTSLSGFEALIRGKKVTCLGKPFYHAYSYQEKKRVLNEAEIDHLLYAVIIAYPIYSCPMAYPLEYAAPEHVIHYIQKQKKIYFAPMRYLHLRSNFIKRLYQLKKWILG